MSTEIKVTSPRGGGAALYWFPNLGTEGRVDIGVRHSEQERETAVGVSRADFLAAVAKECDVIVVDRAELPEVTGDRVGGFDVRRMHVGGQAYRNGDEARESARDYIALAEYLDAHPPVDEAQVEALATDLGAEGLLAQGFRDIARRLVAAGWSK